MSKRLYLGAVLEAFPKRNSNPHSEWAFIEHIQTFCTTIPLVLNYDSPFFKNGCLSVPKIPEKTETCHIQRCTVLVSKVVCASHTKTHTADSTQLFLVT